MNLCFSAVLGTGLILGLLLKNRPCVWPVFPCPPTKRKNTSHSVFCSVSSKSVYQLLRFPLSKERRQVITTVVKEYSLFDLYAFTYNNLVDICKTSSVYQLWNTNMSTLPASLFAHNLGFPRIGIRRELKIATEKYWHGMYYSRASPLLIVLRKNNSRRIVVYNSFYPQAQLVASEGKGYYAHPI